MKQMVTKIIARKKQMDQFISKPVEIETRLKNLTIWKLMLKK